ncbi:MAG: hypothetical protein QM734_12630 [Cyclobacteriaceae bacterium]
MIREINQAIAEATTLFEKAIKKDQTFLSKNILMEMEKLSSTYHSVINLIMAFADLAANEKKGGHSNFVNHLWIKSWRENEELKKATLRKILVGMVEWI